MADEEKIEEQDFEIKGENEGENIAIDKAKKALKECLKEKKEYLDGWKRAKADSINEKKRNQRLLELERISALSKYALAILPVLDSIDIALRDESSAKSGIENIYTQCIASMKSIGIEIVNPIGEVFDPHKHQSIGEMKVEDKNKKDTIVAVERVGAEIGDTVIRPAMVKIGVFEE